MNRRGFALLFAACWSAGLLAATPTTARSQTLSDRIYTNLVRARDEARQREARSNAMLLGLAIVEYQVDNDETLPPLTSPSVFRAALAPYIIDTRAAPGSRAARESRDEFKRVFIDPGTQQPFLLNRRLSRASLNLIADPASAVVFYSPRPNPLGNRIIGCADFHPRIIPEASWKQIQRQQHIP